MGEKSLIFTSNTGLFLEYTKTPPNKTNKKISKRLTRLANGPMNKQFTKVEMASKPVKMFTSPAVREV